MGYSRHIVLVFLTIGCIMASDSYASARPVRVRRSCDRFPPDPSCKYKLKMYIFSTHLSIEDIRKIFLLLCNFLNLVGYT